MSSTPVVTDPSSSNRNRKRFQEEEIPAPPRLALDREGTILSLTRAGRTVLEYSPEDTVNSCFFSHVHSRNMHRVMRDLADMVSRGKRRAQWLLRLRTGNDRWRWYRASVQNCLGQEEDCIFVRLRPL